MDKDTLINNLLANYGKYGVTRAELEPIIDDGIQNYDLSLESIYSGLKMSFRCQCLTVFMFLLPLRCTILIIHNPPPILLLLAHLQE